MSRIWFLSLAIIFGLLAQQSNKPKKARENNTPVISSFVSSSEVLHLCHWSPFADKPEVDIRVYASDADNEQLTYAYSMTGGRIRGEGSSVVWDLKDVIRGTYQLTVKVTDGKGGETSRELKVTTVDYGSCDPPPPPCREITVSCESTVENVKRILFVANVQSEVPLNHLFHWTVNAGRITAGQNAPRLTVDASRDATGFENITATVQVGGVDPSCYASASCTTRIK
jgi:hypothetical protein